MAAKVTTEQTRSWMETPPLTPVFKRLSGELIARMPWLDRLANPLQSVMHKLYGKPGAASYKVKDALSGVWLGHPVHPVLVDIPIGAWSMAAVLDFVWLVETDKDAGIARAADISMWVGLAGALGSVATGLTNWIDTDGAERRTGMLHALLNTTVTGINVASCILRLTGQRRSAIALSTTAYAITAYSSYLGGELAYTNAIGVNRVAGEGGSDDYVAVIDEKDLQPGKLTRVDVAGIPAVLIKDGSDTYAIAATCSHLGGPLDEGTYEDGVVYCPWHSSGFCMRDGSVRNSPAVYGQPTFAVRTRNGKIELRRLEHA